MSTPDGWTRTASAWNATAARLAGRLDEWDPIGVYDLEHDGPPPR